MNCAAHHLVKIVKRLEDSNFTIKAVNPEEPYSSVAKLQQADFVSELGYPPEAGEEPDGYEHLSTRFMARLGDTPVGTFWLTQRHRSNDANSSMRLEAFIYVHSIIGNAAM
jgi:hypothetical protein